MVISLLLYMFAAFVVAMLVTKSGATSFIGKALPFWMIGIAAALISTVPNSLYWAIPMDFTWPTVVDQIVAWIVAGSVAAAIVKPERR